jgi:hypothetical protein
MPVATATAMAVAVATATATATAMAVATAAESCDGDGATTPKIRSIMDLASSEGADHDVNFMIGAAREGGP